MANPLAPINALQFGPGILWSAPIGSTEPTPTVAGSVLTHTVPAAFLLIGATEEGHEFVSETTAEDSFVAEYLESVKTITVSRNSRMDFAMAQINASNWKIANNGGTITTTGSTTTTLSKYEPPELGSEVRRMLYWQSDDLTEALLIRQGFQSGALSIQRRKGTQKSLLPVSFKAERPATGLASWTWWGAGADRA